MIELPLFSDAEIADKVCRAAIDARETMSDEDFHIWLEGFKTLLSILVLNNCEVVCFKKLEEDKE